jgi:hypothetical protein
MSEAAIKGMFFDWPDNNPTCDHQAEIIAWDEWQLRERKLPPADPAPWTVSFIRR